ncbi:NAD-dependent epimerase/dehydratase family protein [Halomonas sp. KO116]|uniref:NAD-dependent epimerase/dehydratase family protein n=1 Tax=Halomonas sp. KO116 TaxID=1504981 RepID=UPI0004E35103|nr:NAD-dependent epimerase/dehydratase family protein [Halomonas sp. KO116]AJY52339.1 NAD-dependent epimerase/dehydratase [Halomonas sp. KO116]
MKILVTGANGFVGRHLVSRLLESRSLNGRTISQLVLMDMAFDEAFEEAHVRKIEGSIAEAGQFDMAFNDGPFDLVFHLASIPGGAAEKHFDLGRRVNLEATQRLLELLRHQESVPRLVFASTIAVYGSPMPSLVNDDTPLRPRMSYAIQKLAGEILIEDYSRHGWLDGISLRLPGIVARPPQPSGLLSAFMSDVFWRLRDKERFACPVSPQAVAWWMSVSCCVDNLMHAATLSGDELKTHRSMVLPVLRLTMAEVIEGLVRCFGHDRLELVEYQPDKQLEATFGAFPEMHADIATGLGFTHDGDVDRLIEQAVRV